MHYERISNALGALSAQQWNFTRDDLKIVSEELTKAKARLKSLETEFNRLERSKLDIEAKVLKHEMQNERPKAPKAPKAKKKQTTQLKLEGISSADLKRLREELRLRQAVKGEKKINLPQKLDKF